MTENDHRAFAEELAAQAATILHAGLGDETHPMVAVAATTNLALVHIELHRLAQVEQVRARMQDVEQRSAAELTDLRIEVRALLLALENEVTQGNRLRVSTTTHIMRVHELVDRP